MALLGGRDSGGWLVVTFVPVPSEGMKIWRGKSNPRPFEGVCFSSIPTKIWEVRSRLGVIDPYVPTALH